MWKPTLLIGVAIGVSYIVVKKIKRKTRLLPEIKLEISPEIAKMIALSEADIFMYDNITSPFTKVTCYIKHVTMCTITANAILYMFAKMHKKELSSITSTEMEIIYDKIKNDSVHSYVYDITLIPFEEFIAHRFVITKYSDNKYLIIHSYYKKYNLTYKIITKNKLIEYIQLILIYQSKICSPQDIISFWKDLTNVDVNYLKQNILNNMKVICNSLAI